MTSSFHFKSKRSLKLRRPGSQDKFENNFFNAWSKCLMHWHSVHKNVHTFVAHHVNSTKRMKNTKCLTKSYSFSINSSVAPYGFQFLKFLFDTRHTFFPLRWLVIFLFVSLMQCRLPYSTKNHIESTKCLAFYVPNMNIALDNLFDLKGWKRCITSNNFAYIDLLPVIFLS